MQKKHDETTQHMIQCTLQHNPELLQAYEEKELKHGTDPRIIKCIQHLIKQDIPYAQIKQNYINDQHIINALNDQETLGHNLIYHGKIAKTWTESQQQFHHFHNNHTTNSNWAPRFINHLLHLTIQIWKTRNKINNDNNIPNISTETNRINSQLSFLYHNFQHKILNLDNHLYKNTLQDLLHLPINLKLK